MKKIRCKNYSIEIDNLEGLIDQIEDAQYSKVIAIVDRNTEYLCFPTIKEATDRPIQLIKISDGEAAKNLDTCQLIWNRMIELGVDRHTLCLNIGGGVIGDMGGFCAATFMRGIPFIQLPTTLLSQVDASVGGKLGVDYQEYKNMVGIIKDPNTVHILTEFIDSLPYRQILSGFAELLKHGLIRDRGNYDNLVKMINLESVRWEGLIYDSVNLKRGVTDEDPFERGLRKILNFGHTIGHAIESVNLTTENPLLHGEAIAIGMIAETFLSFKKGMISKEDCDKVKADIIRFYGHHPERIFNEEHLLELMKKDKKNRGQKIRFTLLSEIGKAVYDQEVDRNDIFASLEYYKNS